MSFLLFLWGTSLVFALAFEWDTYTYYVGCQGSELTPVDRCTILWLLSAKSVALFLPLIPIAACLIFFRLKKTAVALILLAWTTVFSWLTVDAISLRLFGTHVLQYLGYFESPIWSIGDTHIEWLSENVFLHVGMLFLVVALVGIGAYAVAGRACDFVFRKLQWLSNPAAAVAVTALFLMAALGAAPSASISTVGVDLRKQLFSAFPSYGRMQRAVALDSGEELATLFGSRRRNHRAQPLCPTSEADTVRILKRAVTVKNRTARDVDLTGWVLQTSSGDRVRLKGLLKSSRGLVFQVPTTVGYAEDFLLIDEKGLLRAWLGPDRDDPNAVVWRPEDSRQWETRPLNVYDEEEAVASLLGGNLLIPRGVDRQAFVTSASLPNVILIVVESFRHSAVGPWLLKDLDTWSRQGLHAYRHYSVAPCSHTGLFALLYGRTGYRYRRTLNANIHPQLIESLRRSGYQCVMITSGEMRKEVGLPDFLGEKTFDAVIDRERDSSGRPYRGLESWPEQDTWKLGRIRRLVSESRDKPQFIFTHLMSSHFPYMCSPGFEAIGSLYPESILTIYRNTRSRIFWGLGDWRNAIPYSRNRYRNAVLFLESKLMRLVKSLDPKRNIVIVTGDHGESLGEDGLLLHGGSLSEIQTRVPFIMVGGSVKPHKVAAATFHPDLLRTLLGVLKGEDVKIDGCQGRNMFCDNELHRGVVVTMCDERRYLVAVKERRKLLFKFVNVTGSTIGSPRFVGFVDKDGKRLTKTAASEATNTEPPAALSQFVREAYCRVLERPVDHSGLYAYTTYLLSGRKVPDLIRILILSQEHTDRFVTPNTRSAAIEILCEHLLARHINANEARKWASVWEKDGVPGVVDGILKSKEYRRKYGKWTVPGGGRSGCE